MNHTFKSLMIAAGVVASIGSFSSNAVAAPLDPFTIDPLALAHLNPNCVGACYGTSAVVDRIDGAYTERVVFTGPNTFTTTAFMGFTGYDLDGSAVFGGTTGLAQGNGYNIYAFFTASGTFSTVGTVTTLSSTSGSAQLVLDTIGPGATNLTTFNTTNTAAFGTCSNCADDQVLANINLLFGAGQSDSTQPANSGRFGLLFNPTSLTALGQTYFIAPNPFYVTAFLNGVFDPFTIGQTSVVSGSGNLFFTAVPEPASLTLLGLGLVGLARRRFAKSK